MGTILNHPTRIKHEATLAIERELFGSDAVFDRNPMERAIDLGLHRRATSINADGTWNYGWFNLERGSDGQLRETLMGGI